MWQGYIYLVFSKGRARIEMQKFLKNFTKTIIAFPNFTDKEGQSIKLIKSNEIAFIILMIFAITLTETLS